jgi:hypothetical protein
MGTGLDGRGKGIIVLKFCDVTCDVTLASKPLQVAANACYESQVISGRNRRRALRACNLCSLLLIACWFGYLNSQR